MWLNAIISKLNFDKNADRLGPDLPFTHFRLYFNAYMVKMCKRKFKHFGNKAAFRPGAYAVVCSKISLGENVVIRPGTMLFADPREGGAGIVIEDNVLVGSGVHFYTNNHEFSKSEEPIIFQGHAPSKPILLKTGCWIGANAIILPGVTIGKNAVVGAGSVVTKSIPDRVVAVGSPAKIINVIQV